MLQRRSLIHLSLAVVALVIIFYPYFSNKPDPLKVEGASIAALTFLEQLDAGNFEESWRESSVHLRSEIPLETWLEQLSHVRHQVGALQQRNRTDYNYTKEAIEGIPEGEYMSFFYTSDFAGKKNVKERVTLFLEADAVWRVAGYFVE